MGEESQKEKDGIMVELEEAIEFAKDGIVSKTLMEEPQGKVVFFCFTSGQSLSEHTVPFPAAIFVIRGSGNVMIGKKVFAAKPGAWLYMPADLPHAIQATDDFVFLLHLFKATG